MARGRTTRWTPEADAYLRERYDSSPKSGACASLARALGLSKRVLWGRAKALGLTRTKEPRWTAREKELLEQMMTSVSLREIARRLGRSERAAQLQAKRMRLTKKCEGYTAHSLAQGLGVGDAWVRARITSGKLRARRRRTDRVEGQKGDFWYISDGALLEFVMEYPYEVPLRSLDQVWFMDLIATALWEGRNGAKARANGRAA